MGSPGLEEVFDFVVDVRNEPRYNLHIRRARTGHRGTIGVGTLSGRDHLSFMDAKGTVTFEPVPRKRVISPHDARANTRGCSRTRARPPTARTPARLWVVERILGPDTAGLPGAHGTVTGIPASPGSYPARCA